jgi:uncharacterized DUF497 family protein
MDQSSRKAQHRHGEDRMLAIGLMEGIEIVVVYVMRANAGG